MKSRFQWAINKQQIYKHIDFLFMKFKQADGKNEKVQADDVTLESDDKL